VIDPLFLDDLKMEFEEIHNAGSEIKIRNAAKRFQNKLAGLRFLESKTQNLIQINDCPLRGVA
jgi:hypothetical protein